MGEATSGGPGRPGKRSRRTSFLRVQPSGSFGSPVLRERLGIREPGEVEAGSGVARAL